MSEISDKENIREYTVLWSTEEEYLVYNSYGQEAGERNDESFSKDETACCICNIFRKIIGCKKT